MEMGFLVIFGEKLKIKIGALKFLSDDPKEQTWQSGLKFQLGCTRALRYRFFGGSFFSTVVARG